MDIREVIIYVFEDYFSRQSPVYAQYRPWYPSQLFAYLADLVPQRHLAWDAGAGNGQASIGLVEYFDKVYATDASSRQIANALPHPQISYRCTPAERSKLRPRSADLVTAAQALHWFDLPRFFPEVQRVLKPKGVLAVWCYDFAQSSPEIDSVIRHYYTEILGPYWSPRLRLVETGYSTIEFPFEELPAPAFTAKAYWDLPSLIGYLGSWSSIQNYMARHKHHPIEKIRPALVEAWGKPLTKRHVSWPLSLRVFRR